MYELIQARGESYYIQCPAKIGLYIREGGEAVTIDSGNDQSAGRKVRQILDAHGWHLRAIYNTHSHADHIGGNRYLQRQTGCAVYAPGVECALVRYPMLEPAVLYAAKPPKELTHKSLLAQESDAQPLTEAALVPGLTAIPLPGHSFDMTGYRTEDDVVYLGDCLSSRETLEKYQIHFLYDVGGYLSTLEMVEKLQAAWFVPAHAPATEDIAPLARYNIQKVEAIAEDLLERCATPVSQETLLRQVFDFYQMTMDFEQYALVSSTLRSYLTWLKETGRVIAFFENNTLLFQRL